MAFENQNISTRPELESIKKPEEISAVLNYEYTDLIGRVFSTVKSEGFDLAEVPSGAGIFDGSVETPYGSFMMEVKISEARVLIGKIKELYESYIKLSEIERNLKGARSAESAGLYSWQAGRIKDGEYVRLKESSEQYDWERNLKEREVKELEKMLAPYKV